MTPRAPNASSSNNIEFDLAPNGIQQQLEDDDECLPEMEEASIRPSNATRTGEDMEYQRLLGTSIPPTHRRSDAGSSNGTAVVEIPDDVFPSPTSTASRPSQHFNTIRTRPQDINRSSRQAHPHYSRNSARNSERAHPRSHEGNTQGHPRSVSPPAGANIAPAPYLHLYHFYAYNGECVTDFRVGSSIQYTAIDIVHDEGSYQIRAWYRDPPNGE